MAAQKIMDIVAKTGEYQDQSGMTKGRYQNVGSLMAGDDGRQFIIMERWFSPAGLPNPQNRSSAILSLFEPNGGQQGQQQAPAPQQPGQAQNNQQNQNQYQQQSGGYGNQSGPGFPQ